MKKIADYFGVSTEYLLGRDEKAPAPEEPEQEQDAIDAEFADRVSRLSFIHPPLNATACPTDRISRISEGKARPSARS